MSSFAINRMRDLLEEFEPSRERSLAATKLDEFEMWLSRCKPATALADFLAVKESG